MVETSEYSSILERVLFSKHTLPKELKSTTSSILKMQSSFFNSLSTQHQQPHQPLPRRHQYQPSPRRTPDLSASSSTSSLLDCLRMSDVIDFPISDIQQPSPLTPPNSEADKIQRNTLYLTFNAPRVDEYHRGLFLTYDPEQISSELRGSGRLFHASYIPVTPGSDASHWVLETRSVKDLTTSASLVLVIRLGTLDTSVTPIDEQFKRVSRILEEVPLGRENREKVLGKMKEGEGNPVLEGYDCIVWSKDALTALVKEGVLDLGGKHSDEIMAKCRAMAGPPDAKTMVGVDFGGFKVVDL